MADTGEGNDGVMAPFLAGSEKNKPSWTTKDHFRIKWMKTKTFSIIGIGGSLRGGRDLCTVLPLLMILPIFLTSP